MQVTFVCDLIFRTINEQILPYLKEAIIHVITSGEIGEQSFGYTGIIFFAHEYLCQILKK